MRSLSKTGRSLDFRQECAGCLALGSIKSIKQDIFFFFSSHAPTQAHEFSIQVPNQQIYNQRLIPGCFHEKGDASNKMSTSNFEREIYKHSCHAHHTCQCVHVHMHSIMQTRAQAPNDIYKHINHRCLHALQMQEPYDTWLNTLFLSQGIENCTNAP